MRKCDCGGELKLKKDFFNQDDSNTYDKLREEIKKEYGSYIDVKGYNCIVCGQCYNENYQKEDMCLGWMGEKNDNNN